VKSIKQPKFNNQNVNCLFPQVKRFWFLLIKDLKFVCLQVVSNRETQETLLCTAYVFEVSTSEHGAQHHIYRLVKDWSLVSGGSGPLVIGHSKMTTSLWPHHLLQHFSATYFYQRSFSVKVETKAGIFISEEEKSPPYIC